MTSTLSTKGRRHPWVVTGMHRSGTSAVASLLADLGVDLGERLLPADPSHPHGLFEDADMVAFARTLLHHCAPGAAADGTGHADWGWLGGELIDTAPAEDLHAMAGDLVAHRQTPWGWKDPRSTLFLDLWASVLPDARFVLVYRDPWDVQDSLLRLGHAPFLSSPAWGHGLWLAYNRRLVDFAERFPDRTVLIHSPTLLGSPDPSSLLLTLLDDAVAPVAAPPLPSTESTGAGPTDPALLTRRSRDTPIAALHSLLWPDENRLLHRLDDLAVLPGPPFPDPRLELARGRGRHRAPGVAVVVTSHDDGLFLGEAIASAEVAAPPGSELLVVDDGSTDPTTLALLDRLASAGYRVLRQEPAGVAAARNTGFSATTADFVIPLDADNRLRPGFIERAVTALESDVSLGACYGDRQLIGLDTSLLTVPDFDPLALIEGNSIDTCAVIRRTAWRSTAGYDPGLPLYEDWEFWLALDRHGWGITRLPGVLHDYLVRPGSMLRQPDTAERAAVANTAIQERYSALHRQALLARVALQDDLHRSLGAETEQVAADNRRLTAEYERVVADNLRLAAETAESRRAQQDLLGMLDSMAGSASWRLTRPLRSGKQRARGLMRVRPGGRPDTPPEADPEGPRRPVDFFIIGAQKGGTNAVYEALRGSGAVSMSRVKEPHFFDDDTLDWSHPDYTGLYTQFDDHCPARLRGEATPIYSYWPGCLERIRQHNPAARLILLLRNPIYRALSHWRMERRRGWEDLPFGEAIRSGRRRVRDAPGGVHRIHSYVERGFYSRQLARVEELFPSDQVLVLTTDQLWRDPTTAWDRLGSFLGVPLGPPILSRDSSRSAPPSAVITPHDRTLLSEVFADEFRNLVDATDGISASWHSAPDLYRTAP